MGAGFAGGPAGGWDKSAPTLALTGGVPETALEAEDVETGIVSEAIAGVVGVF